jgi:muramidase (phage lysozyme)
MSLVTELNELIDTHPSVRAFLRMLRVGEGTSGPNGYNTMFGGGLFTSFADHPRKTITAGLAGNQYTSTAAGAYQFLKRTWDDLQKTLQLPDFSPRNQDIAALFLIRRRGALPDLLAGRIEKAITKCNKEWASLPGSPYGQPTRTMAQAMADYNRYLAAEGVAPIDDPQGELPGIDGIDEVPPAPPAPAPAPQGPYVSPDAFLEVDNVQSPLVKGTGMSPFILPAISAIIDIVPKLGKILGSGSAVATRNIAAVETIVETAKAAIGARNEQELVEEIKRNKESADAVKASIESNWFEITEMMLKAEAVDEKSREQAVDRAIELANLTGGRWIFFLGAIALLVVLLSYAITAGVLFYSDTFSDETRAMLLGQVVILGFATVMAFLFGSNIQNRIAARDANARVRTSDARAADQLN